MRRRLRRTLAGRLCPAVLGDGSRFDDMAGGRFAVVTADPPSEAERTVIRDCDAVLVTARPSGELHRRLRDGGAGAALVRPDGTVLSASSSLSRLCRVLPWFTND